MVAAIMVSLASCGASGGKSADDKASTTTTRTATTSRPTTTEPPSTSDAADTVRKAVDQTLGVDSFTLASDAKLSVATDRVHLAAKGSVDYSTVVGEVEIMVETSKGTQNLAVRSDGTKLWVSTQGQQAPAVPDGKTWIEGDASRLAEASNFKPTGLVGVLLALRGTQDAKQVGSGKADGVATKTYETTVSYSDAVDAAGTDAQAFKTSLALKADKDPNLKMRVEIGSDDLIRSFVLDVETTGTVSLEGHYTVDLRNVDDDVTPPDAPPTDQILSGPQADQLLDQLIA